MVETTIALLLYYKFRLKYYDVVQKDYVIKKRPQLSKIFQILKRDSQIFTSPLKKDALLFQQDGSAEYASNNDLLTSSELYW